VKPGEVITGRAAFRSGLYSTEEQFVIITMRTVRNQEVMEIRRVNGESQHSNTNAAYTIKDVR